MFDNIGDFRTTLSGNVLTVNGTCSASVPCNIEYDRDPDQIPVVYQFTHGETLADPQGTGAVRLYFDGIGHTLAAVYTGITAIACSGGIPCLPGAEFPAGSKPLYTWEVAAGQFASTGTSWRTALSRRDGRQGATGPAGPAGATGPAGTQGDAGPAGATGPQGNAGPQGPAGATGPGGGAGAAGPSGPAGIAGPTGAAGAAGATGPAGVTGPGGPAGPTGATGPAGPSGASGSGAVSLLTGDTGTSANNTLINTGMSFSLAPGTAYTLDCNILFTVSTTSGVGLTLGVSGPGTPTQVTLMRHVNTAATAFRVDSSTGAAWGAKIGATATTVTALSLARLSGTIENGTTAGTLNIQFSNIGTTGTTVVKRGSWCRLN